MRKEGPVEGHLRIRFGHKEKQSLELNREHTDVKGTRRTLDE